MMHKPKYPNLELMEYQFKQQLINDDEWKTEFDRIKYRPKSLDIEAFVFPQIWGSTNTAFDVMPDGSPTIGGQAVTRAYTVVLAERTTKVFAVFVDDKPAYIVKDATPAFYDDLRNQYMKSCSQAKKYY